MSHQVARDDAQQLVDEFLGFAIKMLSEHGEFYPFGGYMKGDSEIVWEGAADGTERPKSQALIEILRESHRQLALTGEIKASCIVYDVLTIPPGEEVKRDSIAIEIDHRDNYSVGVLFPYSLSASGQLVVEKPFAVFRRNCTFAPATESESPPRWQITSSSLSSAQVRDQ